MKKAYHSMDMNPTEIRVALFRSGSSQAEIARQCKVSPATVCKVIDGFVVSHRVRTAIADATGIDIRRLWPSTYIMHGGPRKVGRPKSFKEHENN